MARRMRMTSVVVLVLAAAAAVLLHGTEAAVHVVGDTYNWQVPPNSTFYSAWSSSQTFRVGDTLRFNFATGVHDVATVTETVYNNCDIGSASNVSRNGPVTITLDATGMHYYFCTFGDHCSRGQKLAVNVTGTASSTPTPSGSPPPPPTATGPATAPPPPNSASSTLAATFALIFISLAMGSTFYL